MPQYTRSTTRNFWPCESGWNKHEQLEVRPPDQTLALIREVLAAYPAVEKVILYGSRAQGTYRQGSDIDLVLFGAHLDLQVLAEIAGRLDDLPIPYQVDLSLWDHIAHEGLREHILRVGVVLYQRRCDEEA